MLGAMNGKRLRPPFVFVGAMATFGCGGGAHPNPPDPASDARDASDASEGTPMAETSVDAPIDASSVEAPDAAASAGKARPRLPDRGEGTTGSPCNDDATCDPAHTKENFCTNDGDLSFGTIYPTPVCIGSGCTVSGDDAHPAPCDGERGLCVAIGTASVCFPRCTFDDDGAPPRGCIGNDLCSAVVSSSDEAGRAHGEGYCVGGCLLDAECTKGDHCQVDQGQCVGRVIARTIAVGAPCGAGSNPPEVDCNCRYAPGTLEGYCTQLCVTGDATRGCPSGSTCISGVTKPSFTHEPPGLAGNCMLNCTTDDDCFGLSSKCVDAPSGKICRPGG